MCKIRFLVLTQQLRKNENGMLRQIRDQPNIGLVNIPFPNEVLANKGTKGPRKLKLTISVVSGEGFMFSPVP